MNKQYRRLARENRTDAASSLREMVQEGNQRWDGLQRRAAAIIRRLRVRLRSSLQGDDITADHVTGPAPFRAAPGLFIIASFYLLFKVFL